MKDKELTPVMRGLRAYMLANGGRIVRYPGGFWAKADWKHGNEPYFGTTTVEALVARGVIGYTVWREGKRTGMKFPVEAKLCAPAAGETGA